MSKIFFFRIMLILIAFAAFSGPLFSQTFSSPDGLRTIQIAGGEVIYHSANGVLVIHGDASGFRIGSAELKMAGAPSRRGGHRVHIVAAVLQLIFSEPSIPGRGVLGAATILCAIAAGAYAVHRAENPVTETLDSSDKG
jgi:hypothetical protein